MLNEDRQLLQSQAAKLYTLELAAERERKKVKRLIQQRVPNDDPKMLRAMRRFTGAYNEWKQLEIKHLQLQRRLGGGDGD